MRQVVDWLTSLSSAQGIERAQLDARREIPNVLSVVAEVPASLRKLRSPIPGDGAQSEAFLWAQQILQNGVSAGGAQNGAVLAPGVWRIRGQVVLQFFGGVAIQLFDSVNLVEGLPGAGGFASVLVSAPRTPGVFSVMLDHIINAPIPYTLQLQTSASLAADNVALVARLLCVRLL